jgi:hypothetical protein
MKTKVCIPHLVIYAKFGFEKVCGFQEFSFIHFPMVEQRSVV